jgi:hypothetical protein
MRNTKKQRIEKVDNSKKAEVNNNNNNNKSGSTARITQRGIHYVRRRRNAASSSPKTTQPTRLFSTNRKTRRRSWEKVKRKSMKLALKKRENSFKRQVLWTEK